MDLCLLFMRVYIRTLDLITSIVFLELLRDSLFSAVYSPGFSFTESFYRVVPRRRSPTNLDRGLSWRNYDVTENLVLKPL